MDEKKTIKSIATALVSQYGDDAQTVAMLRAAEFAAELNNDEAYISGSFYGTVYRENEFGGVDSVMLKNFVFNNVNVFNQ